jgi:5-methylcytosine-specific restriction enzyme A
MKFTKGNLALRDHLQNGKRVFMFESVSKGFVKFVTEVEVFDVDYFETNDTAGVLRIGIKFFFKKAGIQIPILSEITTKNPILEDPHVKIKLDTPGITERKGLVTSRVGQGAYRKRIIHRWEYKCAVTSFDKLDVLIASHIVPWADSTDNERLDVDNGILLSPTYDALFDRHLITFENNGKIILSDVIDPNAYKKIGVTGVEIIKKLSQYNLDFLERHRIVFNCQH